jgi:hypothetical protein
MSKIEVNEITQQSGTTLTVGGGACKTATVDATTVTLGRSGGTVSLASGATQSGFGRTGTVDWDTTPKTATFTAVSGDGFFANTSGGAFTMNLPAGSAGAIVSVADYAGTWDTNALTVSPNGTDKIGGVNANVDLETEGQSVTFIFVDSTQGWINTMDSTSNVRGTSFIVATGGTITTSGNCKIHTFTGPGTFTVCSVSVTPTNNVVSYMVAAGGGGGGWDRAGGGGAGGFRENKSPVTPYTASPLNGATPITVTATGFPITVGAGGAGGTDGPQKQGVSGSNSIFSTITSAGGGGGGSAPGPANGAPGGSGGGTSGPSTSPGSGNTPPVSPPQGNDGGTAPAPGGNDHGGGGGGATAAGTPGTGGTGGPGGAGATTSINASPTAFAGGGGGGASDGGGGPRVGGSGGAGGGGTGGSYPGGIGTAGTANTGGGGAGGGNIPNSSPAGNGGAGGSGIVIIRYKFQ